MNPATDWQQARWKAFRSAAGGQVFSFIAGQEDVWTNDPYDEESIHPDARQVFSELLELAADRERNTRGRGRVLLLQGDAGSGKTHLLGAFRREVERLDAGYFAYAQMTTGVPNLRQYLLRNVVDCLQRHAAFGGGDAWMRLSDALVERPSIPVEERDALRNSDDYPAALTKIRARLLDELKRDDPRHNVHADILTALLAIQRRDGKTLSAAMKYFRAEPLSPQECDYLCSPQGLGGADDPEVLFDRLLRVVQLLGPAGGNAFVLCIDQMEELWDRSANRQTRFPELVSTICTLTDQHPGLLVVLACLGDFYLTVSDTLYPPQRDRVEMDPPPIRLKTERTADEVLALVRKRMNVLDDEAAISTKSEGDGLFPFLSEQLIKLQGSRPRQILAECHEAWKRSRRTDEPPTIDKRDLQPEKVVVVQPDVEAWPQRWNDFRNDSNPSLPKKDSELADILAWGVNELASQTRVALRADSAADLVHLTINGEQALAGICEGSAQGGKLSRQIESLKQAASTSGRTGVVVRSTEFAKSPRAQVYTVLGELLKASGRHVKFPETDWRALSAWRAFAQDHQSNGGFRSWVETARPLSELQGLRDLVQLDKLLTTGGTPEPDVPDQPPPPAHAYTKPNAGTAAGKITEPAPTLDPASIDIGTTVGLRSEPVSIAVTSLTQHVAVLGGTGSGKTTLAMTLIEHLLLRGVPAILVDRKGDLARYADSNALAQLSSPLGKLFREKVDVRLYTPGNDDGRPLALTVLPAPVPNATSRDVKAQAEDAAQALGTMLGYRESQAHNRLRAALFAAIQVLLEIGNKAPSLKSLLDLMSSEDAVLLERLGYLDQKLLGKLIQDVETFRQLNTRFLATGAEPLDAESLLGKGPHAVPGRARLSVISTKFLGANEIVQFWVAQLMIELARFASANPTHDLQAVIMLDEADLYLPAIGKPASKQPLENALRRFRSNGIGIMLATQSPGDIDYRCRENIQTWLVGRVKEARAIEKLRVVFGLDGGKLLEKLGQHVTGEFCVVRADLLTKFKAEMNLLRTEQMSDAEILHAAKTTR
jgi:Helicase HerA, central domain/AAA ATPase domain